VYSAPRSTRRGRWRSASGSPSGTGVDAQVVGSDDGIVVRLPDVADEPPGADLVTFDGDEIRALVEEAVGTSALFASRFRGVRRAVAAAAAPRSPQAPAAVAAAPAGAQLLDVAREYADFPVTLEAARECLQDVFDVPGLVGLMGEVASRKVRLVEVETQRPSPFARSLLFGYVGALPYEGDAPLAERSGRRASRSTPHSWLADLLGRVELARACLDPEIVRRDPTAELQWLSGDRHPARREDVRRAAATTGRPDRRRGAERGADPQWMVEWLPRAGPSVCAFAARERWIAVETPHGWRDALGWRCR
jgi:ATP-dependent Lhr-like helicase